jgi:hypothetical protein
MRLTSDDLERELLVAQVPLARVGLLPTRKGALVFFASKADAASQLNRHVNVVGKLCVLVDSDRAPRVPQLRRRGPSMASLGSSSAAHSRSSSSTASSVRQPAHPAPSKAAEQRNGLMGVAQGPPQSYNPSKRPVEVRKAGMASPPRLHQSLRGELPAPAALQSTTLSRIEGLMPGECFVSRSSAMA